MHLSSDKDIFKLQNLTSKKDNAKENNDIPQMLLFYFNPMVC